MKKGKHAPGPWKVEYNEAIYATSTYGQPDCRVADVYGEDTPQRAANANLIAAAPELLAACRAALFAFEAMDGAMPNLRRRLQAVISKVEGGVK